MRPTRDQWAMELVRVTAKRATCCRRQVGCVILNARGHVLATGYNGVAAGLPHCNEPVQVPQLVAEPNIFFTQIQHPNACPGAHSPSGTNLDGCQAIHAEQNALLQCRDVYEIDTIYVSCSPCMTCAKLLLNTSCRRIVFEETYPHSKVQSLWELSGRIWDQFVCK